MTESGPRVYIVKISIKGDVAITSKPARNFSSFKELLSDAGPYEVSAYDPNTRQYLSCGSDNVFIETTFSSSKNQEKLNKGLIALHSEAMYKPQSHVQYAVRFSSIVKVLCFRVLRNRDGIVIDDFQVVPPSEEFAHGASRSVPGWV